MSNCSRAQKRALKSEYKLRKLGQLYKTSFGLVTNDTNFLISDDITLFEGFEGYILEYLNILAAS